MGRKVGAGLWKVLILANTSLFYPEGHGNHRRLLSRVLQWCAMGEQSGSRVPIVKVSSRRPKWEKRHPWVHGIFSVLFFSLLTAPMPQWSPFFEWTKKRSRSITQPSSSTSMTGGQSIMGGTLPLGCWYSSLPCTCVMRWVTLSGSKIEGPMEQRESACSASRGMCFCRQKSSGFHSSHC